MSVKMENFSEHIEKKYGKIKNYDEVLSLIEMADSFQSYDDEIGLMDIIAETEDGKNILLEGSFGNKTLWILGQGILI